MKIRLSALVAGLVAVALVSGCHSGTKSASGQAPTAINPTTAVTDSTTSTDSTSSSDSSTNSDSSMSSDSASSTDSSSDSSATPAANTGAIAACKLVPLAQVATLAKQAYTQDEEQDEGTQAGCAYDNADATATGVNITVYREGVDDTWNTVHTGNITELTGVGDAAFWDNDNTVYAKAKGLLIQINGLSDKDASAALAKAVADALP